MSLGYIDSYTKPPTWSDVQPGLERFGRQARMTLPSPDDRNAWRPVIHRMYACVAIGSPAQCSVRI